MRSALYPPDQCGRKGAEKTPRRDRRERKTVRKEKEEQHGHEERLQLIIVSSGVGLWLLSSAAQPLRYV